MRTNDYSEQSDYGGFAVSTITGKVDWVTSNGVTSNGVTSNGVTSNGVTSNGVTSNGVTSNKVKILKTVLWFFVLCFLLASSYLLGHVLGYLDQGRPRRWILNTELSQK